MKSAVSIVALIEETAAKYPEWPCLEYGEQLYTYRETNEKANQLAAYLRSNGAGPGQLVGIFQESCPEMIISMIAILKSGAAYVPLSTLFPNERLAYMLNECDPVIILTHSLLEQRLAELNHTSSAKYISLDLYRELVESQPCHNPLYPIIPSDLAYIIYTSGSTGKPKGVMIPHQGIPNLVLEQIKKFQLRVGDRVLQNASFAFDASVSEIFTTLIAGATLILLQQDGLLVGDKLQQILREKEISIVTLTPSVLATLPHEELPDLLTLITAGEACTLKLVQYWAPKLNFINAYGPTEVTVCATMHVCQSSDTSVYLGNPIANTALYLLNDQLQPVANGQIGELYISSVGLAMGYLNAPELTNHSFIANPYADGFSKFMYRTGDLCQKDSEGKLEWLSREDHQIKVSGIRIELGELEFALREYTAVEEAVVLYNKEKNLIIAYLKSAIFPRPNISQIRNYLLTKFPMYMLPSRFMFLDEFPVLTSGKIDRNSLPSMEDSRPNLEIEYAAPRSSLENVLAEIWSEVLKLDQVGIYDNFFELGGQSLMSVQIVSRIRTYLDMDIPLHIIFNAVPTIEQTALAIEQFQLEQIDVSELEQLLTELELMDASETKTSEGSL